MLGIWPVLTASYAVDREMPSTSATSSTVSVGFSIGSGIISGYLLRAV
jgi:hypothetical protein